MKTDNNRFIFPNEWKEMIKLIKKDSTRMLFELQMQTGGRFDELIHVRPRDFDFDRETLHLWKTKTKARKGEKVGKPRTLALSREFSKKIKRFCKNKNPDGYLFDISQSGYNQLLKAKMDAILHQFAPEFSSHNIRKTHGMYLKAMNVDIAEICTRLGHDYNTYLKHYGSASVFTEIDMREIENILGRTLVDRLRGRRH